MASLSNRPAIKKPPWLKIKLPTHDNFFYVSALVKAKNLHTICQSARCPNVSECWSNKTATFLILRDTCTRDCSFCAVKTGIPTTPVKDEALQIAETIKLMGLNYVVITSVTRDDLPDGGASAFYEVVKVIKKEIPDTIIEALIPDFSGDQAALEMVVKAGPAVLNHNLEVPEAVYPLINRPKINYHRSLKLLERAKKMGAITKSGLMIGLGEAETEIIRVFKDLSQVGCDLLSIGQYLQATKNNVQVVRYYAQHEFARLKEIALFVGLKGVESGPLVRSSYRAHEIYNQLVNGIS